MKRNKLTIFSCIILITALLVFVRASVTSAESGSNSLTTSTFTTTTTNVLTTTSSGDSSESGSGSSGSGSGSTGSIAVPVTTSLSNTISSPTLLKPMLIDPEVVTMYAGGKVSLKARQQNGEALSNVSWAVYEPKGGSVNGEGVYTAPLTTGIFHAIARYPGFAERAVSITVKAPISGSTTETKTTSDGTIKTTTTTVAPTAVPVSSTVNATAAPAPTPTPTATVNAASTLKAPEPIRVAPATAVTTTNVENRGTNNPVATTTKTGEPVRTTAEPAKAVVPNPATTRATDATSSASSGPGNADRAEDRAGANASSSTSEGTDRPANPALANPVPEIATKLESVATQAEDVKVTVIESKERLIRAIDDHIADVIRQNGLSTAGTSTEAIKTVREKLQSELEANLTPDAVAAPEKLQAISAKITSGLDEIDRIAPPAPEAQGGASVPRPADKTLESLVTSMSDKANELKAAGADLLYKDSNNDGISDYDSVHVYNIDPVKPSPVTVVDGKEIKAGDKVLLGYDPTKADLVKVDREEPRTTAAPVAPSYKVTDVKLADATKKLELKGEALPNSYVTIYIYSTPITVTVKTDANGEWNYTLDKELETGEHTVYTASVDNGGKILARSSGFTFTKTAEAATLDTEPANAPASATVEQPTILETNNIYIIITAFLAMVLIAVGIIGVTVK